MPPFSYPPPMPNPGTGDFMAAMWRMTSNLPSGVPPRQYMQSIMYYKVTGPLPNTTDPFDLWSAFDAHFGNSFLDSLSNGVWFVGWQWYWTSAAALHAKYYQRTDQGLLAGTPGPLFDSFMVRKWTSPGHSGRPGRFWIPGVTPESRFGLAVKPLVLPVVQDFADRLSTFIVVNAAQLSPILFKPSSSTTPSINHCDVSPLVRHLGRRNAHRRATHFVFNWYQT